MGVIMDKGINKDEMLMMIKKIEMYKNEEIKLQSYIKSVLESMKQNLNDTNYKTLDSRLEMLYMDFETSIKNKDNYSRLILNIINSYDNFEENLIDKLQ